MEGVDRAVRGDTGKWGGLKLLGTLPFAGLEILALPPPCDGRLTLSEGIGGDDAPPRRLIVALLTPVREGPEVDVETEVFGPGFMRCGGTTDVCVTEVAVGRPSDRTLTPD